MSPSVRRWIAVYIITMIALVLAFDTSTSAPVPLLRALFALPLVFLFPGYGLVSLFFPAWLDSVKRFFLSLGVSITVVISLGLVINLFPGGLSTPAWAITLTVITLLPLTIAALRDLKLKRRPVQLPAFNVRQIALLALARLLVSGAIYISRSSEGEQFQGDGFTQLWLVPDATSHAKLGILNQEGRAVEYRLVLKQGDSVVHEWDAISLASGAEWDALFPLPVVLNAPLDALLYRSDSPDTVYRQVDLRAELAHGN